MSTRRAPAPCASPLGTPPLQPAPGGCAAGAGGGLWLLDDAVADLNFWAKAARQPEVVAFLLRSLKAKAARDVAFAGALWACLPLPAGLPDAGRGRIWSSAQADDDSDCGSLRRTPSAQQPGCGWPGRSRRRGAGKPMRRGGVCFFSPYTEGAPASAGPPAEAAEAAELPPRPRAEPRSLLVAFDEELGAQAADEDAGDCWQTPAKCMRTQDGGRAQVAPSPSPAKPRPPAAGLLAPLPAPVVAAVAGYLPLAETLRLAEVVRGAGAVLAQPAAFDPLVLDRTQCAGLLRRLRRVDPLGMRPPGEYPLPQGLSRVARLRMELMETDLPRGEDAGAEAPAATPPARRGGSMPRIQLVLDPLEELCRRLRRGWFASVTDLAISNIEDHRLDYHFLTLRGTAFLNFPHLRASAAEGRYTIRARRGPGAPPAAALRPFDADAAARANAQRQVEDAPLMLSPAKELGCQAEAAFLEENTQVFKSGENFHFVHAPWRSCSGEVVRRRYDGLVETWQRLERDARLTLPAA